MGIPKDIDEAACIDGCNKWQLFYKIILPIAKPAIATLFITDFLSTWNEYLLASVIINDNAMKTVPVGIMTFVTLTIVSLVTFTFSGSNRNEEAFR